MQDVGVFVKEFPAIFGCDAAGEVYKVGSGVDRFKKGDRAIGQVLFIILRSIADKEQLHFDLITGRLSYQLCSAVPANRVAVLLSNISFPDGVGVTFGFDAAACALSVEEPDACMPGVSTPAFNLPYPSVMNTAKLNGTLIIRGASSSASSMTTPAAAATGSIVIAITSGHKFEFAKQAGAA